MRTDDDPDKVTMDDIMCPVTMRTYDDPNKVAVDDIMCCGSSKRFMLRRLKSENRQQSGELPPLRWFLTAGWYALRISEIR